VQAHGRGVGELVDEQDRQSAGGGGRRQPAHLRVGLDARREEQAGQPDAAELGETGGHDHVVAVAGHQQQPAVAEHRQQPGHRLCAHDDLGHPAGQVTRYQDPGAQVAHHVEHPGPGQARGGRHPAGEGDPALHQGGVEDGGEGGHRSR